MNKWKMRPWAYPLVLGGVLLLSACSTTTENTTMDHNGHSMNSSPETSAQAQPQQIPASSDSSVDVLTGNTFTLTAKENILHLDDKTMKNTWTYNGTVPGPQLRVKQGETISVTLKNELPEPVTIHWHGLPVPNNMDGIPGVTQNAVRPNESFTYKFKVDVAGTYWYHSHQNSAKQVDKGLYGSLVVEPATAVPVDKDFTLVLDEWMQDDRMAEMHGNGMNHGMSAPPPDNSSSRSHNMPGMEMPMSDAEMMPLMYTIFSVNGKTGSAIQPLSVKEGEKVRIRLINAGYLNHKLNLQGHEFKIVATDGQPINNPPLVGGQLLNIGPGERYDLEFVANNSGKWLLEERSTNPGAKSLVVPIVYEGSESKTAKSEADDMPMIDITKYGEAAKSSFALEQKYDITYQMDLNTETADGKMAFTINGKTFPNVPPLNVQKGNLVKVTLVNKSPKDIHPMHLHGHFFQVVSKNGQPISGSPLVKDTLNILPGESYVVAFEADNPGDWMFHCHDLGHAAQGMVSEVKYEGFKPDFIVDPTVGNMPE
ncbi:multicopper oxidase family protein [Brevibacillus antibioticus]|uniref:Multicopper oxidase family protein n=1 Tax=Brevibacillus antibioticus TaxID=2570228 RepID=A0A4U2Y761_9BACL|nr:multicopper oxidase family protein [Brevibacillus antibioticus]TKI55652.1 multicopper oxidase family protein [Brevibacillus antibioticus]